MEKIVNVMQYVAGLLKNGTVPFIAYKFGTVHAEPAEPGQQVITWSETEDGPLVEKVAIAKEGDWLVTKADATGWSIIDRHGHENTWLVNETVFEKKYRETEVTNIYRPVGGSQKFIKTKEPLTIEQWGTTMTLPVGSYINVTNPGDMYGINPRDFRDTYIPVCYAGTKINSKAKRHAKYKLAKGLYKISVSYMDTYYDNGKAFDKYYPGWDEIVTDPSKYYNAYIKPYYKNTDRETLLNYLVCTKVKELRYRVKRIKSPSFVEVNIEDLPF